MLTNDARNITESVNRIYNNDRIIADCAIYIYLNVFHLNGYEIINS